MEILDQIYKLYPRKRGKTAGMKTLKKLILMKDGGVNREAADAVMLAIQNYKKDCEFKNGDYIKHFSTFMNCWEDYLEDEFKETPNPFLLPEVGIDGEYVNVQ